MVGKYNIINKTFALFKRIPWHSLFYMFYMEPVVFALLFAHSLSGIIMKNQVIYQACTAVFLYNEEDCKVLGTSNVSKRVELIETEIQEYVVNLFMIRTIIESIIPAICGIFVGSWSDHYGRKPLLVVSMIGFSLTYILTAVISELANYYTINPWYYIIAAVPHSILGGNCVFSVAGFCFISDITTPKTRPYRMIFMEVYFFIGLTSGSLISSFVYNAMGATTAFALSGGILTIATIFIAVWMPESLHFSTNCIKEAESTTTNNTTNAVINSNNIEMCNEVQVKPDINLPELEVQNSTKKDSEKSTTTTDKENAEGKQNTGLFSYIHIKEMLKTCLKDRPCNDRAIIWLATGTMFLSIFVIDGAMTVFYLFVREKFHWTVRDVTFYETVSHSVSMLGAIIGFVILRKCFKVSVVTVAFLAFVSEALMSIVRGVATESWHLYLSVICGLFKSLGGPMCRTIVSNIVPATDLGKIFSIKNVLQSIAPFLAAPLYSYIYKQTIISFPGFFNIISGILYAIAAVFIIFILRFKYNHKKHYGEILK